MKPSSQLRMAGALAGAVNGLFGGGGGSVLLPLLSRQGVEGKSLFATTVAVIFPLCTVSAAAALLRTPLPAAALPCLIGGAVGGIIGGKTFRLVPVRRLRLIFGLFLLYGGVRYLL